ncbi:MAG: hypothetical protein ACRC1H_16740 [Caldilineaceae bacterium]
MRYSRLMAWFSVLLLLAVALAGCAPRVGAGETAASAGPDDVVVDLPSIALDVAEDGSLSLGGINLADVVGQFGLPAAIDASQVKQLTDLGIQHIQIANLPNGLALLVNGIQVPSLGWSADTLADIGNLAPNVPALKTVLPLLTQLGVGVTLNLPVAEGVERAPLQVDAASTGAADLAAAQEEFVAGVGEPPLISIPVQYNDDGTWSVMGMTGDQWVNLTGQSFWTMLDQTPDQMAVLRDAGVASAEVSVDATGLHISVNDKPLPSVDWSGGKLASVITLLQENGMLSGLPVPVELIEQFLPIITSSNVSIRATFPAP